MSSPHYNFLNIEVLEKKIQCQVFVFFLLGVYVYMHVDGCVGSHLSTGTCACRYLHGEARSTLGVILQELPNLFCVFKFENCYCYYYCHYYEGSTSATVHVCQTTFVE